MCLVCMFVLVQVTAHVQCGYLYQAHLLSWEIKCNEYVWKEC